MDRYSRMVAWLKVLLPLAALGLLSSLFLISRNVGTEAVIPFADREIEDRMRGQQVTQPFFSGNTANGDEIMVTASVVRAGGEAPVIATGLQARIQMADGGNFTLASDRGTIHPDQDLARFIGRVVITSSRGLTITSDALKTHLSNIRAESPGPVQATGVLGHLDAGRMEITAKTQNGPVHIIFNNGVKLIYDPQNSER